MTIRYHAESLADIAQMFLGLADRKRVYLKKEGLTRTQRVSAQVEAATWESAAQVLIQTTLAVPLSTYRVLPEPPES